MNKGDLINEVAKVVSTKKEAKTAVDCVFESITKALKKKKDGTAAFAGFGTFKVVKMKARKGRNPQTNKGSSLPLTLIAFKTSEQESSADLTPQQRR